MNNIVPLRVSNAPLSGATPLQIAIGRAGEVFGLLLNRLHLPGAIRPMRVHDDVTGVDLEVRVSALFTVVSVEGRDFYFRGVSGTFDGTGMGCR